jgi:hypothetical protein
MNTTKFIINSATEETGYSVNELAKTLSITTNLIDKWIARDALPDLFYNRIIELCAFEGESPELVRLTNSPQSARLWTEIIGILAEYAIEDNTSGYTLHPLEDTSNTLAVHTLTMLVKAGLDLPSPTSRLLNEFIEQHSSNSGDRIRTATAALIEESPQLSLIDKTISSYGRHYAFFAAFMQHIEDETAFHYHNSKAKFIESELLALTVAKTEDPRLLRDIVKFKIEVTNDFTQYIETLKEIAIQHECLINEEFMSLIHKNSYCLEASANKMSYNQIAPNTEYKNIYDKTIHNSHNTSSIVLPIICKALNIKPNEIIEHSSNLIHPNKTINDTLNANMMIDKYLNAICEKLNINTTTIPTP